MAERLYENAERAMELRATGVNVNVEQAAVK